MARSSKVKMIVKKLGKDEYQIPLHGKVRVYSMGNVVRLQHLQHKNEKPTVLKIDKDRYQVISTGEIREYEHTTNRSESLKTVRTSMIDMRAYLTTNVTDPRYCRWATLTYGENMMDTQKLYHDFRNFMKDFRKWGKSKGYDKIEYIIACEPQSRGAWHIHAVFIFDKPAPYIPNFVPHIYDETLTQKQNYKKAIKHPDFNAPIFKLWKHGWVSMKSLKHIDNVGAYLTSYLTDICLDDEDTSNLDLSAFEIEKKPVLCNDGTTKEKRFAKGARMFMYPKGFRLWRYSKGVKKPTFEDMTYKEAQKKVSTAMLTYESSIQLTAEDDSFKNIIVNQYYNLIRKNSQDSQIRQPLTKNDNLGNKNLVKKINNDEIKKAREFFRQRNELSKVKQKVEIESTKHTHNGSKIKRLPLIPDHVQGFKVKSINEMWVLPELVGKYTERAERMRATYLFTQNNDLHNASENERQYIVKRMQSEVENHIGTDYWLRMDV